MPQTMFQAVASALLCDPEIGGAVVSRVRPGSHSPGHKLPGIYLAFRAKSGEPSTLALQVVGNRPKEAKAIAARCAVVLSELVNETSQPPILGCDLADGPTLSGAASQQAWTIDHGGAETVPPPPDETPTDEPEETVEFDATMEVVESESE